MGKHNQLRNDNANIAKQSTAKPYACIKLCTSEWTLWCPHRHLCMKFPVPQHKDKWLFTYKYTDIITDLWFTLNGGLSKSQLKKCHGWGITSHIKHDYVAYYASVTICRFRMNLSYYCFSRTFWKRQDSYRTMLWPLTTLCKTVTRC